MKLLMVCLGNICRSPLAEGIARSLIDDRGLDWEVDSAGTSGWHDGQAPDNRSIAVAANHGIDLTAQRSRKIEVRDLEKFDLILAMDRQNQRDVLELASDQQRSKVQLILNYAQPGLDLEVPDPYYGGAQGFEHVYQLLLQACGKLVDQYA
ncbi:MAG: low molecular weight phosphotyrosine protein phosphatase [Saprospiraceae bacterium]|nr:low molecular weight phosphotyrosine protein phosphatase [Saprospiraceae bacterium]